MEAYLTFFGDFLFHLYKHEYSILFFKHGTDGKWGVDARCNWKFVNWKFVAPWKEIPIYIDEIQKRSRCDRGERLLSRL